MLRVMHLVGAAKPGGAEMFAFRLLVALHKRRDVNVLAVVRQGSWLEGVLRGAGVPVEVAAFGGLFDWTTPGRVRKLARGFRPDVVQSWMNRATRFMPQGPWAKVGRLGGFYDLKYYRGRVEHLVCNTEDLRVYCVGEGWNAARVRMISNFIPLPPQGWSRVRKGRRTELGFSEGDCVAMMAGRLHSVKGVDVALQALAKLPETFKLLLVGEGPMRDELMGLARHLGVAPRVVWAGWQDELAPYAAAADMWLAPSRHEPLGNTVLDAWVHEVPVIATCTGGLDMLVEEGVTGLKVPVDDPDELAKTMLRLAESDQLQKQVKQGGLARFKRDYSEESIVESYMKFYSELSKGRTA